MNDREEWRERVRDIRAGGMKDDDDEYTLRTTFLECSLVSYYRHNL